MSINYRNPNTKPNRLSDLNRIKRTIKPAMKKCSKTAEQFEFEEYRDALIKKIEDSGNMVLKRSSSGNCYMEELIYPGDEEDTDE